MSMGARLRSISDGATPSRYAEELAGSHGQLAHHKAVGRPQLPNLVLEEFMAKQQGLVIVDGFPRYPDRVGIFKSWLQETGSRVLAVCHIEVPDAVAMERAGAREQRNPGVPEDEAFLMERLDDYYDKVVPTLALLGDLAPLHIIDGRQPLDDVAGRIVVTYSGAHVD